MTAVLAVLCFGGAMFAAGYLAHEAGQEVRNDHDA